MSWGEDLTAEVAELFAEFADPAFDEQTNVMFAKALASKAKRDREDECFRRRHRYRTDPEYAERLREFARQWVRENAERIRQRRARVYNELLASGRCTSCRKPVSGCVRCAQCREENAAAARQRRARVRDEKVAAGVGMTCGCCGLRGHNRRTCQANTSPRFVHSRADQGSKESVNVQ